VAAQPASPTGLGVAPSTGLGARPSLAAIDPGTGWMPVEQWVEADAGEIRFVGASGLVGALGGIRLGDLPRVIFGSPEDG
jgi:hypothetical protein